MMQLHVFDNGDKLHRYDKSLAIVFDGPRRVLSTSPYNGGVRDDLVAVFNNDGKPGAGMACKLKAPTYAEHLQLLANGLGLDGAHCTGISTAADMENVSIKIEIHDGVTVTAVVTGGIETNGGRVGDEASWDERELGKKNVKLGTINIMLCIDANLPEGTMARALVTCTEAKTAAIQELIAPSRYSMGLATGSGTDGTIVVCNTASEVTLTNAGKHAKLGEQIGRAVMVAVKDALDQQSNLNSKTQHHIIQRMSRFGITQDTLFEELGKLLGDVRKPEFVSVLESYGADDHLVIWTSLYAHLLDQLMWKLISPDEAARGCGTLLNVMLGLHGKSLQAVGNADETLRMLIEKYKTAVLELFAARFA